MRGTPSPRLSGASPPRKGAVPHSGAARGLGQGPVGRRLPEQQRLPQQPQVLAAGLRAQRGVRGRPAEAAGARSRPPRQRLPGRGPAPLEGSPARGTWRPEPPEPPKSPFHPHPGRSESTGLASFPQPGCVFWPKAHSMEAAWRVAGGGWRVGGPSSEQSCWEGSRGRSSRGSAHMPLGGPVRSLTPSPPMRMGGPGVLGHSIAGKPGRPRWHQPRVFTGTCISRGTQLQVLREGPEGLGTPGWGPRL